MPLSSTRPHHGFGRRLARRLLLWLALPLILICAAGAGSLHLLCIYQPELVTAAVQQQLIASTGLPWRIRGHIRPSFLPRPGIVATDVRITAASTAQDFYANASRPLVHAKSLRISLDFSTFWTLTPRLSLLELDEPTVNLVYDGENRPLWLPPEQEDETPDEAFVVSQGSAYTLKSVADAMCAPHSAVLQPVVIHNGTLSSYTSEGELLLSFSGVQGRFNPDAPEENLHLSATFDLPDADISVSFALAARVGCDGIPARGLLSGNLRMTPPRSRTLTAHFSSTFLWRDSGKDIDLPDFRLEAEGDYLGADLELDLSTGICTGKVDVRKLSLVRWFEFGRVLPPGLQEALDALTGGFDLVLNTDKAEARDLHLTAGPLSISGYVGTPDFSAPAVVVDVALAGEPDLDLVFPFLAVAGRYLPEPVSPEYDHPPLAPYPKDPPPPYDPGPSSVGYDIRITVAKPTVHGVSGGPLEVRVFPHMVGETEKTRVSIKAESLLNGRADGYLDIDIYSILMHYEAHDMELAGLPENEGSIARISGKVNGVCEIDVPMLADGGLADDWVMRIDAAVRNFRVDGSFRRRPWHIAAGEATAKGGGPLHAVLEEGVRIEGAWDVAAKQISTSWNPKGADAVAGTYEGKLLWPPIKGTPPPVPGEGPAIMERKAVERVLGTANLQGSFTCPLGALLVPVAGKLTGDFAWGVADDRIEASRIAFDGFGSFIEGGLLIDFSGEETILEATPQFKLNPRELFSRWHIRLPEAVAAPKLLTGRLGIRADDTRLRLENIAVEADGAPIRGELSRVMTAPREVDGKGDGFALWTAKLTAELLDLENIFPPDPPGAPPKKPSTQPWDLSFMDNLGLDLQIYLNKAKMGKLAFDKSRLTGTFRRDRFSAQWQADHFYQGDSTLLLQGTVVPGTSRISLRKALMRMRNVNLEHLLHDYTGERSYAGTAELIADVTGILACDADFPAKLSGSWSLKITDGLYPAFLGSEDSTLRNTFSLATASGPLDRGVLRSDNFILSGPMVDMRGGGWVDLGTKDLDIDVSITFAKIPTIPVRLSGNLAAPKMKVRGAEMVVETGKAAGFTVFGLIRGVLSLPGRALTGIGSLIGGEDDGKKSP